MHNPRTRISRLWHLVHLAEYHIHLSTEPNYSTLTQTYCIMLPDLNPIRHVLNAVLSSNISPLALHRTLPSQGRLWVVVHGTSNF